MYVLFKDNVLFDGLNLVITRQINNYLYDIFKMFIKRQSIKKLDYVYIYIVSTS